MVISSESVTLTTFGICVYITHLFNKHIENHLTAQILGLCHINVLYVQCVHFPTTLRIRRCSSTAYEQCLSQK